MPCCTKHYVIVTYNIYLYLSSHTVLYIYVGEKENSFKYLNKCLNLWNSKYSWYWKILLVVSRLFAGDNLFSADFLLVTTGCHQTFQA